MKGLTTPRMKRCIGCHSCSLDQKGAVLFCIDQLHSSSCQRANEKVKHGRRIRTRKPAAAARRKAVALPPDRCSMRLACIALSRPGLLLPA